MSCLAGVLIVCLLPGMAAAEYVVFRNDTRKSVCVQAVWVQRGVARRDQSTIRPGETTPKLGLDVDKVITITCGQTGQVLFREGHRASRKPLGYHIRPDPNRPNRVRLIPQPLKEMPGRP